MMDPELERWRLILGAPAQDQLGSPSHDGAERDAALDWLYGRDEELGRRDIRRDGGSGPTQLTTVDWLDGITRLFPKETVERLQRDAIERYEIHDIVTDPAVLETGRAEPGPAARGAADQAPDEPRGVAAGPADRRGGGPRSDGAAGHRGAAGVLRGPGLPAEHAAAGPATSTPGARSGRTWATTSRPSGGC